MGLNRSSKAWRFGVLIRDYGGRVLARCVGQSMALPRGVPRGGWCNFTGLKICSGAGFSGRRFGGAFCSFGLSFGPSVSNESNQAVIALVNHSSLCSGEKLWIEEFLVEIQGYL